MTFSFTRDQYGKINVDAVALLALLIAVVTGIVQIFWAIRGNDAELIVPRQVLINYEARSDGREYVQFSAIMSYTNAGNTGYNETIIRELMRYTIGCESYTQVWQKFVQTEERRDPEKGISRVDIIEKNVAAPFVVKARESASHETYFAPAQQKCENNRVAECVYKNFVTKDEFRRLIDGVEEITFLFAAEIPNKKRETVACKVEVNDSLRNLLDHNGWAGPPCWEVEAEYRDISDAFDDV